MRLDTALLCDAVTVREGLLHILGGGITRVWRPNYPAPLGASLALRVLVHPTEVGAAHKVRIVLLTSDGNQVAEVEGEFGVGTPGSATTGLEEVSIAVPLNLTGVPLPARGAYSFEVLIDGIHQASIPFTADLPENKPT